MNWKHIEAVMKCNRIDRATFGEVTVITNGHIALIHQPGTFDIGEGKEYAPLSRLWQNHKGKIGDPVIPGGLYENDRDYSRQMGDGKEFINEAFFRCFDSSKTTWALGPIASHADGHHCLIALVDGEMTAIVMPMRTLKTTAIIADVSDTDVFASFCSEGNGYYLISRQNLREKIADAREMIRAATNKIDELEEEREAYGNDISSMERRLDQMSPEPLLVERSTVGAQPQSD